MDPDGSGPMFPISATIYLNPEFDTTIESSSFALPLQVTTGITIFGTFSLQVGGGIYPAWGHSDIKVNSVDGTTAIGLDQNMEGMVQQNGYITVSGSTDPVDSKAFGYFVSGALKLVMGGCYLTLPVLWDCSTGIGAGLNIVIAI
jgi:hypothetical protein